MATDKKVLDQEPNKATSASKKAEKKTNATKTTTNKKATSNKKEVAAKKPIEKKAEVEKKDSNKKNSVGKETSNSKNESSNKKLTEKKTEALEKEIAVKEQKGKKTSNSKNVSSEKAVEKKIANKSKSSREEFELALADVESKLKEEVIVTKTAEKKAATKKASSKKPAEKKPTKSVPKKVEAEKTPQEVAKTEQKPVKKAPQGTAKTEQKPVKKVPQGTAKTEQKPVKKAPQGTAKIEQKPVKKAPQGTAKTEQRPVKKAPQRTAKIEPKTKKGKKKKVLIILAVVILGLAIFAVSDAMKVKKIAMDTKDSAKALATALIAGDIDGSNKSVEELDTNVNALCGKLSSPLWKVASIVPYVGGDVKSANILATVLDDAIDKAIRPAIKVLNENPISGIKVDDGFNAKTIVAYLDFVGNIMPDLEKYVGQFSKVSFKVVDLGSMTDYLDKINGLSAVYDKCANYLPLVKAFLGDGSDKYYLITAQATNEMRATGGFPGSVGSISIKDGIVSLGEFSTVEDYLPNWNAKSATPSSNDIKLFGFWVNFPRNACCYLNFERTAYCWAEDCEFMTGKHVDGIISMTPAVVQKLLDVIDGEITISDGTVVNGDNATKAIMYDLYFKYFSKENYAPVTSNEKSDAMFAEIAAKSMDLFLSTIDIDKIDEYINIFEESTKENIFKLWLRDEDGENLIKTMGMAGTTNDDKNNPFTGIYLSINVPCKMGWFIDIEPVMSNPVKNADGSMTYDMKVTFRNTISKQELKDAAAYILGRTNGDIRCNLYFTAPMEGKVSNFQVEAANKFSIKKGTYCSLDLGYCNSIFLYPGKDVVVKYKVSTAPGVSTPLAIVQTPTVTKFR